MKESRIIKKYLATVIIVLMSINTLGALVSDNDDSAFITKAEFDSIKNNFQSLIDKYNASIDSKIDEAIASYLAGINLQKTRILENYYEKYKVNGASEIKWTNQANYVLNGKNEQNIGYTWDIFFYNRVLSFSDDHTKNYWDYTLTDGTIKRLLPTINEQKGLYTAKQDFTWNVATYSDIQQRYAEGQDGYIYGLYDYDWGISGTQRSYYVYAMKGYNTRDEVTDLGLNYGATSYIEVTRKANKIFDKIVLYSSSATAASGQTNPLWLVNAFPYEIYTEKNAPIVLAPLSATLEEWTIKDSADPFNTFYQVGAYDNDYYVFAADWKHLHDGNTKENFTAANALSDDRVLWPNSRWSPKLRWFYNDPGKITWLNNIKSNQLKFKNFNDVCSANQEIEKGLVITRIDEPGTVEIKITPEKDGYIVFYSNAIGNTSWNGLRDDERYKSDSKWQVRGGQTKKIALDVERKDDYVFMVYLPNSIGKVDIDSIVLKIEEK